MTNRSRERAAGRVADAALCALIIAAPLAGGSWKLAVLPVLAALAALAASATLISLAAGGRSLHVTALWASLLGLSLFTALQALPLGEGLLAALSPKASELRAFVVGAGGGPLSYEPSASLREALKLLIYAAVALVAHERVRARKRRRARAAGGGGGGGRARAGGGGRPRLRGIERLFGLLELSSGASAKMFTTFVNPNHAAGFMALGILVAAGLALSAERSPRRVGALAAGLILGAVSALVPSKGGLAALAAGLLLFALLSRRSRHAEGRWQRPAVVAAALLLPLAGLLWQAESVGRELGLGEQALPLGLTEKLAGFMDVSPMVLEHPFFGIGRGAFVSVYTQYKTSALQLTFAFPENLVAQLTSEWGLVVGGLALLGLFYGLMVRLGRPESVLALAVACGVAAVVLQNMVDFSLEMPGVAIPVAALFSATGAGLVARRRVPLAPASAAAAGLVVVLALGAAAAGAFLTHDLDRDLLGLEREIQRVREAPAEAAPAAELERLALHHPASALLAAKLAYLAEVREPPDLEAAIRWANRTLYLAPSYAWGHVITGRLLIRAGHRRQGFGELRRAWALGRSVREMEQVLALARGPEEVRHAIPRRDEALDVLDERELARVLWKLDGTGRDAWALALLPSPAAVPELDPGQLAPLGVLAHRYGALPLAESALERRLALAPADESAVLALARLLVDRGDLERLEGLLGRVEPSSANAEILLELRFRAALSRSEWDRARDALELMKRQAAPDRTVLVRLAGLEADLEVRAGRPAAALPALDRALLSSPNRTDLRMRRARILRSLGRLADAQGDAELVLLREPEHKGARALVEAVQKDRLRALGGSSGGAE